MPTMPRMSLVRLERSTGFALTHFHSCAISEANAHRETAGGAGGCLGEHSGRMSLGPSDQYQDPPRWALGPRLGTRMIL